MVMMMMMMRSSRPMAADRRMRAAARVPRPPAWSSSRARGEAQSPRALQIGRSRAQSPRIRVESRRRRPRHLRLRRARCVGAGGARPPRENGPGCRHARTDPLRASSGHRHAAGLLAQGRGGPPRCPRASSSERCRCGDRGSPPIQQRRDASRKCSR
eukprot:scaffold4906_cov188-Prasinococcus_capsulatus_cf.AAC.1